MKEVYMVLTNSFDPDVRVLKEALYLSNLGYKVRIYCWDRESRYDINEKINNNIEIIRFHVKSKYGSGMKQIIPYFKFIIKLRFFLKKVKNKIIHCHDLDGIIAGYLAAKRNNIFIFDMHEYYELNGKNRKIRPFIHFIVGIYHKLSNYVIYVNKVQLTGIKKSISKKFVYLPNYPMYEDFFEPKYHKKLFSKERVRISYIGAVRQFEILKNFIDVKSNFDNISINIHGNGVDLNRIRAYTHNMSEVNATGKYDYKLSKKLYKNTDILLAVYPSNNIQYNNSLPTKLFESIITLTPIIVNNRNSELSNFVISNNIGFSIDAESKKDIEDFYKFIEMDGFNKIYDEKVANLVKIQKKYSWETIVDNLNMVYKEDTHGTK